MFQIGQFQFPDKICCKLFSKESHLNVDSGDGLGIRILWWEIIW